MKRPHPPAYEPRPRRLPLLAAATLLGICLALPAGAQTSNAAPKAGDAAADPTGGYLTGTAVLVGAGAYTYVRGKHREEQEKKKAPGERVYFENHTKNGTLRQGEKRP